MEIFIVRDRQRYGPYTEQEVRDYLQSGDLSPIDLAWREGMNELEPLEAFLTHVGQSIEHPEGLIDPANAGPKPKPTEKKGTMQITLPAGLSKMHSKYSK